MRSSLAIMCQLPHHVLELPSMVQHLILCVSPLHLLINLNWEIKQIIIHPYIGLLGGSL